MDDLIDFKTYFTSEKNSAAHGRILIACYSNIYGILDIIASKNVINIDQNSKLMCKKPAFLSAVYYYNKKLFVLAPSGQK